MNERIVKWDLIPGLVMELVNLDKEGRFLLPENLKTFASIIDEIAFIGQGYFFQIVNPKTASELQQKSRDRLNLNKKTLSRILSGRDE